MTELNLLETLFQCKITTQFLSFLSIYDVIMVVTIISKNINNSLRESFPPVEYLRHNNNRYTCRIKDWSLKQGNVLDHIINQTWTGSKFTSKKFKNRIMINNRFFTILYKYFGSEFTLFGQQPFDICLSLLGLIELSQNKEINNVIDISFLLHNNDYDNRKNGDYNSNLRKSSRINNNNYNNNNSNIVEKFMIDVDWNTFLYKNLTLYVEDFDNESMNDLFNVLNTFKTFKTIKYGKYYINAHYINYHENYKLFQLKVMQSQKDIEYLINTSYDPIPIVLELNDDINLLTSLVKLKTLKIKFHDRNKIDLLNLNTFSKLENLTYFSLDFNYCRKFYDDDFKLTIENKPMLECLELKMTKRMTNKSCFYISQIPNLKGLLLGGNNKLTDEGLKYFYNLKYLDEFHIYFEDKLINVTLIGLLNLVNHNKIIRIVRIELVQKEDKVDKEILRTISIILQSRGGRFDIKFKFE